MIKLPANADVAIKVLEFEREKMKLSFELAAQGLKSGSVGVGLVFVGTMAMLWVGYLTNPKDTVLISGAHIVLAVGILISGVVLYFAFVFRREARLMTQLTDKFKIDFSTGQEGDDV